MTFEFFQGGTKALRDRLAALAPTTLHHVIKGKPGEWVIVYTP